MEENRNKNSFDYFSFIYIIFGILLFSSIPFLIIYEAKGYKNYCNSLEKNFEINNPFYFSTFNYKSLEIPIIKLKTYNLFSYYRDGRGIYLCENKTMFKYKINRKEFYTIGKTLDKILEINFS